MHNSTRPWRAAGMLLLLCACAEQTTAPLSPPAGGDRTGPTSSGFLLSCTADVAAGTLGCEPASSGSTPGGANANLIVGSQHQFVRLSNAAAPSIVGDTWSLGVVVQNLTLQPMGTADGTTPDGDGVRVFFASEPSNGVTVANHDGEAAFTGSSPQKYYQYSGGSHLGADAILSPEERSSAKTWEFTLNGAATFTFNVLVSAAVPDESAYSVRLSNLSGIHNHFCAEGSDGNAYCWGNNNFGQLGDGTTTNRTLRTAVQRPVGVSFSGVVAGGLQTCAEGSDGNSYCWGLNSFGQLGDGTNTNSSLPVRVLSPVGVTLSNLTAGTNNFTCAEGSDGNVYCWGRGNAGQLGNGANADSNVPVRVSTPVGVTLSNVEAGGSQACAEGSDGNHYCWGDNTNGELGNGTNTSSNVPVRVSAPVGVTFSALTAGLGGTCAEGSDGNAYCWGNGGVGQLGNSGTASSNVPVRVSAPVGVTLTSLSAGQYNVCAEGSDGKAYCWGGNHVGQLGIGSSAGFSDRRLTPTQVLAPAGVTLSGFAVASGTICAKGSDGPIYCWGGGVDGRLGNGLTTSQFRPVIVGGTR